MFKSLGENKSTWTSPGFIYPNNQIYAYVDFIARLCQNLNKTVAQPGLRDLLKQVLAYDSAKKAV